MWGGVVGARVRVRREGESEKRKGVNGQEETNIVLGGGWDGESEA